MKLLLLPTTLFLLTSYTLAQSCTVNADCPVQGECCRASNLQCDQYYTCVTTDGLKGNNAACSSNTECATGCCSDFWKDCSHSTAYCMDDPQDLTGKGIFVIILAILATVAIVIVFCVGCNKMKKEKS